MNAVALRTSSKCRDNKGFSLVELIIVIAIMAVLTAILAPQLLRYVERSRAAKDATTLDEVSRALQLALTDEATYVTVVAGGSQYLVEYIPSGAMTFHGEDALTPAMEGADALATEVQQTLGGQLGFTRIDRLPALVSRGRSDGVLFTLDIAANGNVTVSYPPVTTTP